MDNAAKQQGQIEDSFLLGGQVLQLCMEHFAVHLDKISRAPKPQRERGVLDAGADFELVLLKLRFPQEQAHLYRALYVESLRGYLDQPFREPSAT